MLTNSQYKIKREVLSRVNIVDVIKEASSRVIYLGEGKVNDYKACCPLHDDSTPSMYISSSKQVFKCHGCGEGGTVINFYAKLHGLDEWGAIEALARKHNIDINVEINSKPDYLLSMSKRYAQKLQETPEALKYLLDRGINQETIKKFGFGYSPGGIIRYNKETYVRLGVAAVSNNGECFELMRKRITIPIRDINGRTLAFAGRILDTSQKEIPKYLNTRESEIFRKSDNLFGIDLAIPEIRRSRTAILVEGYMDVAKLHQEGITNVCGLMGTSISPTAFKLLWSHADKIIFCLDGDNAGKSAVLRNMLAAAATMTDKKKICVALLPAGMDPDEYVAEHGGEATKAFFENTITMGTFVVSWIARKHTMDTPEGRAAYLDEIMDFANSFKEAKYIGQQIFNEAESLSLAYAARSALNSLGIGDQEKRQLLDLLKKSEKMAIRI
jgi:DNA primase